MAAARKRSKGKVSGTAGRFGPRYGRFIRKRVDEMEQISRAAHLCPRCDQISVKRAGTGIWICRKCGFKFAGGAYAPKTPALQIAQRSIEHPEEQGE